MLSDFNCLVFEYMDLGDLNKFLRHNASLSNNPPQLMLVSICYQIALGMNYISSLKYVHCDLATRN